jgi:antitoxin component YwqK of YwqJK toxin-antitoxin module
MEKMEKHTHTKHTFYSMQIYLACLIIGLFFLFTNHLHAQRLFYNDSVLIGNPQRWCGESTLFYSIKKMQKDSIPSLILQKDKFEEFTGQPLYVLQLDTIEIEASTLNGKIEGNVCFFYKNKSLTSQHNIFQIMTYKNNLADGPAFTFIGADTIIKCFYRAGVKQGQEDYKSDKYLEKNTYSNGKLEGLQIRYFKGTKKIWQTSIYHNGLREGLYAEYDYDTGFVTQYFLYNKDKVVKGSYPVMDSSGKLLAQKEFDSNGCLILYTTYNSDDTIEFSKKVRQCD